MTLRKWCWDACKMLGNCKKTAIQYWTKSIFHGGRFGLASIGMWRKYSMEFNNSLKDKILTLKPIWVENLEHQYYKPVSVQIFSCIKKLHYSVLAVQEYQEKYPYVLNNKMENPLYTSNRCIQWIWIYVMNFIISSLLPWVLDDPFFLSGKLNSSTGSSTRRSSLEDTHDYMCSLYSGTLQVSKLYGD